MPYRRPESVLILVYTLTAELLLLKRCQPLAFWQSVTGSLEPGESHATAAKRELREETGLPGDERLVFSGTRREFEIDPRWRGRYAPGISRNTESEWRFCIEVPCDIRLDEDEHSEFRWMPLAEARETVWSWTNKAAIDALLSDLSRGDV